VRILVRAVPRIMTPLWHRLRLEGADERGDLLFSGHLLGIALEFPEPALVDVLVLDRLIVAASCPSML